MSRAKDGTVEVILLSLKTNTKNGYGLYSFVVSFWDPINFFNLYDAFFLNAVCYVKSVLPKDYA